MAYRNDLDNLVERRHALEAELVLCRRELAEVDRMIDDVTEPARAEEAARRALVRAAHRRRVARWRWAFASGVALVASLLAAHVLVDRVMPVAATIPFVEWMSTEQAPPIYPPPRAQETQTFSDRSVGG